MNIFHRITLKSMFKNRTRTIVTAIGVALSAALFCAVTTLGFSILSYLIDLSAGNGDYHVSCSMVSPEKAEEIRNNPNISSMNEIQVLGLVNFRGREMEFNSGLVRAGGANLTLPSGIFLKEGKMPQTNGEIVVTQYLLHLMEEAGIATELGSTITFIITPYSKDWNQGDPDADSYSITGTLVGIADHLGGNMAGHHYSYINIYLENSDHTPIYYDFLLKAKSPFLATTLAGEVDGELNTDLLQFYGIGQSSGITFLILALMLGVILIIVVGSVSLISNAFSISVVERTKEFGLLSSIGATKKQLRKSVRFEAGMLCLMGIPLGLGLGYGTIALTLDSFSSTIESIITTSVTGISLVAKPSIPAFLGAIMVSAGTVYLSAWLPSVRATKITPMDAIRQTVDYRVSPKAVKTSKKKWELGHFTTNMARKYFQSNRKRYRSVVASLCISVILFLCATSVSAGIQAYADFECNMENYDFKVTIRKGTPELIASIRNHDSVSQSVEVISEQAKPVMPNDANSAQRLEAFDNYADEKNPFDKLTIDMWDQNARIYYLEDDAFRTYLQENGINPEPYFDAAKSLAVVFQQELSLHQPFGKSHTVAQTVSFSPVAESVNTIPFVAQSRPMVGEYIDSQFRNIEHNSLGMGEGTYYITADGKLICEILATPILSSDFDETGKPGSVVDAAPERMFCFVICSEITEEGKHVTQFYPYNKETDIVEETLAGEMESGITFMGIGTQLGGTPFGLPKDIHNSAYLTLLRPLSLRKVTQDELEEGITTSFSLATKDYNATKAFLEDLQEENDNFSFVDYLKVEYQIRQISRLLDGFAYAFVGIMTLIAIANVFNTMSTNILLRRRDFGMLKSLGMTNGQLGKQVCMESLLCGVKSLYWSLPVALLFSLAFTFMVRYTIMPTHAFPWVPPLVAVGTVMLVVLCSTFYALSKIKNNTPVEAILAENV